MSREPSCYRLPRRLWIIVHILIASHNICTGLIVIFDFVEKATVKKFVGHEGDVQSLDWAPTALAPTIPLLVSGSSAAALPLSV